jgi:hypothetical protein
MTRRTSHVRQVAFLVGLALSVSTGCAASLDVQSAPSPPDPQTSSTVIVSVPVALLASRLETFLTTAARGEPVDQRLAGDRLLVLTASTFSELPATALAGDARAVELSFGYGCPDACTISFGRLLELLIVDLRIGDYASAPVPLADALAQWPSLSFRNSERSWRVSFDDNGERIVAFEVFGPLPAE